ncbi:hypothetical protein [Saccharothrix coeruleofusca]|uniref:Uncharacterized protein n=1 Tax=Saccharothrix coeruleofusca TaxID=33919 RepID=A0A918API8_9PSEU|nr:hypothetical protein [Saccharothrix coeruleofusca]GGP59911.1 hypothetical protein GCM10010185_35390 [Saccharothrix coeruleofusca]
MTPLLGRVGSLGAALLTGAVTGFALHRAGAPPHWAALVALPAAALALLVGRLPRATDVVWSPPPVEPGGVVHVQASTLATRLAEAAVDPDRFASRVHPRLRRLAQARLRQRHGVPDLADPRAERLLGPELHRLVTDPRAPLPDPKRLAELLEEL